MTTTSLTTYRIFHYSTPYPDSNSNLFQSGVFNLYNYNADTRNISLEND